MDQPESAALAVDREAVVHVAQLEAGAVVSRTLDALRREVVVVLVELVAVAQAGVHGVDLVVVGQGAVGGGAVVEEDSPRADPPGRPHVEVRPRRGRHLRRERQYGVLPPLAWFKEKR